jgi:hypothetical protein
LPQFTAGERKKTTFTGITGIEEKQNIPSQNIFPLVGIGTVLQYGIAALS